MEDLLRKIQICGARHFRKRMYGRNRVLTLWRSGGQIDYGGLEKIFMDNSSSCYVLSLEIF